MVLIGHKSYVALDKIAIITKATKSDKQRKARVAKLEAGLLVDATDGHRVDSLVYLDNGLLVLSAISSETLAERVAEMRRRLGIKP